MLKTTLLHMKCKTRKDIQYFLVLYEIKHKLIRFSSSSLCNPLKDHAFNNSIQYLLNHLGGVMVSMPDASVEGCVFDSWFGQTKNIKIGLCLACII